jgi:small subunit ribosomal protein S13
MIYIFESELSENKLVFISLTKIYGIGKTNSLTLCKMLGWSCNIKIKDLSKEQISKLLKAADALCLILGSDLKKNKLLISKNLIFIKTYRGLRRYQGLPIRGQRTHTNGKTAKKKK